MTLRILPVAVLAVVGTVPAAFSGAPGEASDAQIVFMAPGIPGDGNVQELFTMDLDGSRRTQITHDGLNKFLPHFSPDGTRLVYTKFLAGRYGDPSSRVEVVVYDFASRTETQLTHDGKSIQPVWSPDGQRIAFGSFSNDSLRVMNADGSNARLISRPSGALDDIQWGDYAWSSDDWILFTVAQNTDNCFKVRLDKIRPDGTARTRVTDGGPSCTPGGMEQSGDADPGFSPDGKTIYTSRGFPRAPTAMPSATERRLLSFSSEAWTAGKAETDLSLPSAPDCIEGVPKASPDGTRVLLYRACAGEPHAGVTLTDTAGSYRTWITDGFGPDWNPVANGRTAPCPAGPSVLCLHGGRFQATVRWSVPPQNVNGVGTAVPLTGDTGYYWFFSPNNVEMVLKVVDGRAFNNRFWVFYGALTDVEYTIEIVDTTTGETQTYFNPYTHLTSASDTSAFPGPGTRPMEARPAAAIEILESVTTAPAACTPDATNLCLNNGRFRVHVDWNVPGPPPQSGQGTAASITGDTGHYWFFSANNIELIVKVVDGRGFNGKFWVFSGALTNVAYTITVTDTQTGLVKTYTSPFGTQQSIADTAAF